MQAYKTETQVAEDGSLTIRHLPFPAGEQVEVIVFAAAPETNARRAYPLQGTAYRYDDPLEPVAEEEWEAAH